MLGFRERRGKSPENQVVSKSKRQFFLVNVEGANVAFAKNTQYVVRFFRQFSMTGRTEKVLYFCFYFIWQWALF